MASTITAVSPTSAFPGQTVTLTGTNLDAASIDFFTIGGNPAAVASTPARSTTTVALVVPTGTTAGPTVAIAAFKSGAAVTGTGIPAAVIVTATPASDPGVSSLARKYRLDVKDPNTGQYVQVRFLNDLKPSIAATLQGDADYDSNGWDSQTKTMLGWTLDLKVLRKQSIATGLYDRGQEVIRAAHDQFGATGTVDVRWYDRTGGTESYQGIAEVSWNPDGGDPGALATVACTLTGKGVRNVISNPGLS